MNKDLLIHMMILVHRRSAIQMKDRTHVLDRDKLLMYDQDDLDQLAFVAA
jgi:hypothetical protein